MNKHNNTYAINKTGKMIRLIQVLLWFLELFCLPMIDYLRVNSCAVTGGGGWNRLTISSRSSCVDILPSSS